MEISVTSAKKKEEPIVRNLINLYLHDFSEFMAIEPDEDGSFAYSYLPQYWGDPNRYPFLIRGDGKLAGFALLQFEPDPMGGSGQMDMTEFFVLRGYRRKKTGVQAAFKLWDLFPGRWQVRVMKSNVNAYPFWQQSISEYTSNDFQEHQGEGPMVNAFVFQFQSRSE